MDKLYNGKELSSYFKDEAEEANAMKIQNAVAQQYGYEIPMNLLTAVIRDVAAQKFYEIPVADYLPVRVSTEAAWADEVLMFRSFYTGGDFEKGYIETGTEGRLASADATLDGIRVPARVWAKEIAYSLVDIAKAARTGIWDYVAQKEKARKKNWDLGIQKTAFLGSNDGSLEGLLTLSDVNINTTLIPAAVSAMTDAQFQTFATGLVNAALQNNNFTQAPDRLYMPMTDYVQLTGATSVSFPLKSKLEYLKDALSAATGTDFQIKPLAYCQSAQSDGKLLKNRYVLMRYDSDVARFEIPVDYTVTVPNSYDGFTMRNVGYGQHTGVLDARPQEILYLDAQS